MASIDSLIIQKHNSKNCFGLMRKMMLLELLSLLQRLIGIASKTFHQLLMNSKARQIRYWGHGVDFCLKITKVRWPPIVRGIPFLDNSVSRIKRDMHFLTS